MKLLINGCTLVIEGDQTVKIEFNETSVPAKEVFEGRA